LACHRESPDREISERERYLGHNTLALLQGLGEANGAFYRSALRQMPKPVVANVNRIVGMEPKEVATGANRSGPPMFIFDPNNTEDYARAKRTCSGVPSIVISRGGRIWAAWATIADDAERESPVWSQPRLIANGLMLNKPIVLSNGEWMFSVNHRKTGTVSMMQAIVSRDKGETFAVKGALQVDYDLAFSEPMMVERQDGSLWMLLRTRMGMGESISTDGGTTWSALNVPAIKHTASLFSSRDCSPVTYFLLSTWAWMSISKPWDAHNDGN
jgi:hypothetical protein